MKKDAVNPDHYRQFPKESIEMMEAIWGAEAVINFCVLNAFKYRMRLGHKDAVEQDMSKERWYLNKADELRTKINGGAEKPAAVFRTPEPATDALPQKKEVLDTRRVVSLGEKILEEVVVEKEPSPDRVNVVLIAGPKGKERSEQILKEVGQDFMVAAGTSPRLVPGDVLFIEDPESVEGASYLVGVPEGVNKVIIATEHLAEELLDSNWFSISKVIKV